jgi:hypothetical protein
VHIKLFAFELPETSEAKRFARLNKASGGNNHGNPNDYKRKKTIGSRFFVATQTQAAFLCCYACCLKMHTK